MQSARYSVGLRPVRQEEVRTAPVKTDNRQKAPMQEQNCMGAFLSCPLNPGRFAWRGPFILIQLDQLILPAAYAQLRRGLHRVNAMEGLNALNEVGLAKVAGLVHQVQTCLSQRHWVQ